MEIKSISRPWLKQVKQGTRYNPDKFYQSREWKTTRASFIASEPLIQLPPIHNIPYQNKFCVECWKKGKIVDMQMVDHKDRIRAGGSKTDYTNLQSMCNKCHAAKSANERNELHK